MAHLPRKGYQRLASAAVCFAAVATIMPVTLRGHLSDAALGLSAGFPLGLAIVFLFRAVQLKRHAG